WRALREAGRLIVPTTATADRVLALVPDAAPRLRVIWDAPDACFRPAPDPEQVRRRVLAIAGIEDPYLIVVGADQPAKRHDLALAAFAAAAPKPWRLVMVQRPASYDASTRLSRLQ